MKKAQQDIPAWKQHVLENRNKTMEEKRADQQKYLAEVLATLKSFFEPDFIPALKRVEEENISESEQNRLDQNPDAKDLVKRLRGLRMGFGTAYYQALEELIGENIITRKEIVNEETNKQTEVLERVMAGANQSLRLPKGYSKWSLKQIKINESRPEANDNKWVEFWSLKGDTALGRILYNEERDVHYFRPYDTAGFSTFPLTHSQGRKLTREGRNYYFRRASPPPGEH